MHLILSPKFSAKVLRKSKMQSLICPMKTISVSLSAKLLQNLEWLIEQGIASNKADGIRKALKKYIEDQAVEAVLRAKNEPSLCGDLDVLARTYS